MVACTVTGKSEGGLDVVIESCDTPAFLPTMHLSDELTLCAALYDVYKKGDRLERCVYYSKQTTLVRLRAHARLCV